ncbi:MAG: response regulator [Gammaproteobacteria bacterium]|nr:response regulator [Gammaproteobacteria bacterium]MDH5650778.1 response regulator [Gammaproteobacteria bacterium]
MQLRQTILENSGNALLFGNKPKQSTNAKPGLKQTKANPWKIMIIDDDHEVHQVTAMVLTGFRYEGRPIEIIQGYSAADCLALMQQHPDTAVLLLDVVMETESAGLDAARTIRVQLHNHRVRIIIRTGQPGRAPEQEVMANFDINGYVEKTALTAQHLYSCITESLSAWRDSE